MQNCLGVWGGGVETRTRRREFTVLLRGSRAEDWRGSRAPQSPSGRESGFATDKQARSYGKRCFSRREKENAGYFQPCYTREATAASFYHPTRAPTTTPT